MNDNISFIQPKDAWDALSIPEKAEMMRVAVSHGIYNLNDIRRKYNEFALGGDTEEASVSPNEAARMGAMVGAAIASRPKGYIGGSTTEARRKYWQTDNEMKLLTDSVANQYGISPDLLRTRMDSEGYTDARINEINKDVQTGTNRALMGTALFNSEAMPYVAGSEFGLDDVADYINNGTVNLINENWGDGQFRNEQGRWTHMAMGHNYSDNVGIMAATLKALKDIARKDFPNASGADLDRYASAYYNRGIEGGRKWVKRGAKGYKVNKHYTGGNLFNGTTQPSQQMQIGLNVPKIGLDVQGWPNYTTEQLVAYGEENERRRKAIQNAYLNFVTESNDATAVANGRPQNQHLVDKAIQGAKAHAAWEKEHPNLTAWSYLPSAAVIGTALAPLGAAGWTGISALGDAAAATSAGQAITAGLAPLATAASTSVAGAPLYTWADVGLSSLFGGHGVQTAIDEGGISPTTALELAPMLQVVKPMFDKTAMAIENYRYPIGRPQVPENFLTIKPQVRTRVGDVEINNPQLSYRQVGRGAVENFQKTGEQFAPVKTTEADKGTLNYMLDHAMNGVPMYKQGDLWYGLDPQNYPELFTTAEPLAVANKHASIVRDYTTPGRMVRENGERIQRWDKRAIEQSGRRVPKTEDQLNQSNVSSYIWEDGYGYRKTEPIVFTAPFEVPKDVTTRFLRFAGRTENTPRRPGLPTPYLERYRSMTPEQRVQLIEQDKKLREAGVDMSQVDAADIMDAYNKRQALLTTQPKRATIIEPIGDNYYLHDTYLTKDGPERVGDMVLNADNSDNLLYVEYVKNITKDINTDESGIRTLNGIETNIPNVGRVHERGLNAGIKLAKSLGLDGVVSGKQYLEAPLQLHVMDKFPNKTVLRGEGKYNNKSLVEAYHKKYKDAPYLEPKYVDTVEEMRNAPNKRLTYLEPADAFLLEETNGTIVPTKSTVFDPRWIDNYGNMLFDWRHPYVFKSGGKL